MNTSRAFDKLKEWFARGQGWLNSNDDDPDGIDRTLRMATIGALLFIGGFGIWAVTVSLAGAVLASGTVVVDGNVKKVQHATGGTIGEIRVKDGQRVNTGDLLVKLDETLVRANLQVITKMLDQLAIRQARLIAERDGKDVVSVPQTLVERENNPEVAALIDGERSLFNSRTSARTGQKAQLRERIAQLRVEVNGLVAQNWAKTNEVALVKKELEGADKLWQQKLMPITKLTSLQREATRLEGDSAQLISQAAQVRGKISETELQIIQIDQDLRAEVNKDLREAQGKEAELVERRVAAEDQLRHIEIRAPIAGVVHQLSVHTVGGVIGQGEALMLIVPESDALVIEAKVAPQDIDHVRPGQLAFIRFTAFDQNTTPEYQGKVTRISADLTKDAQTGDSYYVVRLALIDGAQASVSQTTTPTTTGTDVAATAANRQSSGSRLALIPGMPAEVHIRTGERTAVSYFLKPLRDQIARAFTER